MTLKQHCKCNLNTTEYQHLFKALCHLNLLPVYMTSDHIYISIKVITEIKNLNWGTKYRLFLVAKEIASAVRTFQGCTSVER